MLLEHEISSAGVAFTCGYGKGWRKGLCLSAGAFDGLPFARRAAFDDERCGFDRVIPSFRDQRRRANAQAACSGYRRTGAGFCGSDSARFVGRCMFVHLVENCSGGHHLSGRHRVWAAAFWAVDGVVLVFGWNFESHSARAGQEYEVVQLSHEIAGFPDLLSG